MHSQEEVAGRALALGLISLRSQYENGIQHGKDERYRTRGQQTLQWAREQKIERFLSEAERQLHEQALGQWSSEAIGECFWRIESMKAAFWCVQLYEAMPSYFEVGKVNEAYARIPEGKGLAGYLAQARLRDEAEIEKERDFAQFLNWRCRTELLKLQGMQPPQGDSYEKVVARALPAIDKEDFPIKHDGVDLLVNGTRFGELGEARGDIMSLCYERQLALEWVLSDDDW
ncbi:MAG: DUF4272 domain-containing protein, partial [Gemmataceae bacterium]